MASLKKSAIQLVLKAKDALSGTVKKSAESLEVLKREAASLKDGLSKLKDQKALLSSFEKQTRATHEAGKAFRAAEARVAKLAKEVGAVEKPTKAMQNALTRARQEVKKTNKEYGRQRESLAKLRGGLKGAGLSSSKLAQQQQKLSNEIEDTGHAFEKANKKVKAAARSFKNSALKKVAKDAEKASSGIGRLTKRFAGLIAASAGLYAIKRGIESILTTGDKFERLNVQLEAIMGSMAEGERALAWIKDFTQNTPFQLEEVSEAFVRLKAFGLDPMDGSMQAIVDQAAKLGGGMERLNGISLAVGQAWAKQKLQGEEILQLVERGVPVWEMLEKATGKNVQELQKLSAAGKLGRDTIALLIAEIGKSAEGAAAKNMSLLSGYVSNLKDSWQNFVGEIADSGALEYTKNLLRSLAEQVKTMQQDGRLSALAKTISKSFIAMGEAIKTALGGLTFDDVVARTKASFSVITSGLNKVASAFVITTSSVSAFFNGFAVGIKGFASAFLYTTGEIIFGYGKMAEALNGDAIAKPLLETTNYLRSLGAEFAKQALGNAKTAKDSLDKAFDAFSKKSSDTNKKFQADFKRNINLNKKTIDDLLGNYKKVEEAVKDVGDTATETFENAAAAMEQINSAKTRIELASLGVALAEALRQGVISQEEYYEATEASRQKLIEFKKELNNTKDSVEEVGDSAEEAGDQQTEAFEGGASIAAVLAGHYNAITAELQGMSSAAHDAFIAMQKGVGSVASSEAKGDIAELKNELKETSEELGRLRHAAMTTFDVTGISTWMMNTAADAAYVKKQFLEQKIALEELFESYEEGELNSRNFVKQGERAADTMNLLNEQDLDKLNSAISSAEDGMAQLGDSSKDTLNSLQDELDQLQGRQDDISRRQYDNQRIDLKAQKAEAMAKGDQESIRNLTSALRLSEQVYNEKRRQAQQEKTKELQKNQVSKSAPSVSTGRQSPQKIIRLEYPGGGVNIGIDSSDEIKLLQALKNAGLKSV